MHRTAVAVAVALALAAPVLAGCGSSSDSTATTSPATTSPPTTSPAAPRPPQAVTTATRGSGPVDVDFAGSLLQLMDSDVGPAFDSATGYRFTPMGGDSGDLANEIKARTLAADVFISANPSKDMVLEGASGGNLVTWYATWATSDLVLGYDPSSRFAAELRSKPWYEVAAQPGFLLGRTDPATDPKGALAVTALDDAAATYHLPALGTDATSTTDVFPETSLVGRLQAGQLDAGFYYAVEAAAASLHTVALSGVPTQHASYTVTIPADAPHPAAALAFVRYLLGPSAGAILAKEGLVPTSPPTVSGAPPPQLRPPALSAP